MLYRNLAARFAPAAMLCALLLPTAALAQATDDGPPIDKVLMITDPQIVGSKTAPPKRPSWTFGYLVDQMSGGTPTKKFVFDWLDSFGSRQTVNGLSVVDRKAIRDSVIDPWKKKDGFADKSDEDWVAGMKLENAPFRLSAIVYRPDLLVGNVSDKGLPTWTQSAGEGRFIFQVVNEDNDPQAMTVIFEYDLPAELPAQVVDWAKLWSKLADLDIASDAYAAQLEQITKKFTDTNPTLERPDNVPLNQLRTNELLGEGQWELREFKIFAGKLQLDTVKRNPDIEFNGSPQLVAYVNDIAAKDALLVVPSRLNGAPFLAGSSIAPTPGFKWDVPGVSEPVRKFKFGINTCNGCHTGETGTKFLHVDLGALAGFAKPKSDFLVGTKPATCQEVTADSKKQDHDESIGDLRKRQCLLLALLALSPPEAERLLVNLSVEQPPTEAAEVSPGGFDIREFLLSRRDRVE